MRFVKQETPRDNGDGTFTNLYLDSESIESVIVDEDQLCSLLVSHQLSGLQNDSVLSLIDDITQSLAE